MARPPSIVDPSGMSLDPDMPAGTGGTSGHIRGSPAEFGRAAVI